MRDRWIKQIGLLLLCVYAAAIVHQALPHESGHGTGESCSLCLLLMSLAVFFAGVVLVQGQQRRTFATIPRVNPYSRNSKEPSSLRGPPIP